MTREVSITEVSRHFSDYLNRVAYRGEHFLLRRGRKVMAELRPSPRGRRLRDLPEILKSIPRLSASEASDFDKDLSRAKRALSKRKLYSPWGS